MDEAAVLWVVDLGNTRLKFGRFAGSRLTEVSTYARERAGEALRWLVGQRGDGYAVLSTGTSGEEGEWRDRLRARAPVWGYTPGDRTSVEVAYATPLTLGTDRLAAAAGARALYPGRAALVVDVGTCITYESLDPRRRLPRRGDQPRPRDAPRRHAPLYGEIATRERGVPS